LLNIFSLKGKCKNCKKRIALRYYIVEIVNGLSWVIAYLAFDFSSKWVITSLLFSALIVVSFMDWDTQEINLGVILFIGLLAVPSHLLTNDATLFSRGIGALIISIPFFLIAYFTGGIGMGDVLLMISAGLMLGYKNTIVGAFVGILTASVAGILIKIITKNSKFAFGPWLCIGIAFSTLFGEEIVSWYLSLIGF